MNQFERKIRTEWTKNIWDDNYFTVFGVREKRENSKKLATLQFLWLDVFSIFLSLHLTFFTESN